MNRIDAKQLIPVLNPQISKQQRRSLLSPSQSQLARQIDNSSNIGMLCSILGRPLKATLKHIKQMAFLDVVLICKPGPELIPMDTDEWVQIFNAPPQKTEDSHPSLPNLEESKPVQIATKDVDATDRDLIPIPAPQENPISQPPAVLDLTAEMAVEGTELELPMEEPTGFSVPRTPHKFTALEKITEMDWTNEHNLVTANQAPPSAPPPTSPPASRAPQPIEKLPQKRPMSATEEELQQLLSNIAKRNKEQGRKGLYHYSSRSQMDMPAAEAEVPPSNHPKAPHSGTFRRPMTPPPTSRYTKKEGEKNR